MLAEFIKEFGTETAMFLVAIVALWRMIVYFTKKDEKTQDKLVDVLSRNVDVVSKNTEAFTKLSSTIDQNTKATEDSGRKIEDLWVKTIRNGK